jgi:hypothetical protein
MAPSFPISETDVKKKSTKKFRKSGNDYRRPERCFLCAVDDPEASPDPMDCRIEHGKIYSAPVESSRQGWPKNAFGAALLLSWQRTWSATRGWWRPIRQERWPRCAPIWWSPISRPIGPRTGRPALRYPHADPAEAAAGESWCERLLLFELSSYVCRLRPRSQKLVDFGEILFRQYDFAIRRHGPRTRPDKCGKYVIRCWVWRDLRPHDGALTLSTMALPAAVFQVKCLSFGRTGWSDTKTGAESNC